MDQMLSLQKTLQRTLSETFQRSDTLSKSRSRNGRKSQRIIVGITMTEQGGELVTWALTQAARPGDSLTILHVASQRASWTGDPAEWERQKKHMLGTLSALVSYCRIHYSVPKKLAVSVQIVEDQIVERAIVDEAQNMKATMIVLGKSQAQLLSGRMHGIGKYCERRLSPYCSILVVRKGKIVARKPGTAKVDGVHTLQALLESQRRREEDGGLEQESQDEEGDELRSHENSATVEVEEEDIFDSKNVFYTPLERQSSERFFSLSNSFDRSFSFSDTPSGSSSWNSGSSVCSPNSVLERLHKLDLRKTSLERSSSYIQELLTNTYNSSGSSSEDPSPRSQTGTRLEGSCTYEDGEEEEVGTCAALAKAASRLARRDIRDYEGIEHGLRVLNESIPAEVSFIRRFTYDELSLASNHFSSDNVVGTGGASSVYKGQMPNEELIAIKRLEDGEVGEKEFMMELMMLSCTIHHPHLVTLLGFAVEGSQRLLVYEYLPNGNLEHTLHGEKVLTWAQRQKVALGAAHALAYLHSFRPRSIIHRDIKSSNILLDANFEAQISDFGLAKWSSDLNTYSTQSVAGTFGYLAPECFMYANFDEKTDVFAFGVVLLELITGQRSIDRNFSQPSLVQRARELEKQGAMHELVDSRLTDIHAHQFKRMMYTAFQCIKASPDLRPTMDQVICLLDPECESYIKPLLASTPVSPAPW